MGTKRDSNVILHAKRVNTETHKAVCLNIACRAMRKAEPNGLCESVWFPRYCISKTPRPDGDGFDVLVSRSLVNQKEREHRVKFLRV